MDSKIHNEKIEAQFSKQAKGYTNIVSHSDALDQLIYLSHASKEDTVLDVACGSGIVACAFAKHVASVTGIDITEGMLNEAKQLQTLRNLENIKWQTGDVTALPYADNSFSIVISRFGFHHFLEPAKVLAEMKRVCKANGIIMIVDVTLPDSKIDFYNQMEKIRDNSHVAALSHNQFNLLLNESGLRDKTDSSYQMKIELEEQLKASFPEDQQKLKTMILNDIGIDNLGINVSKENGKVYLHYPIKIYVGKK